MSSIPNETIRTQENIRADFEDLLEADNLDEEHIAQLDSLIDHMREYSDFDARAMEELLKAKTEPV